MNNLKEKLVAFSKMLACSWKSLESFIDKDNTGSLKLDWLQANWELLIENHCDVGIVLEVYGDGADCNGVSSRVLYPNKLPTHRVVCKLLEEAKTYDILNSVYLNDSDELIFDRFVSMGNDGWYHEAPPFDKILVVQNEVERVVELNKLDFFLQKIN